MVKMLRQIDTAWRWLRDRLERLQPLGLLLFRLWVALSFWRAGVVKHNDPMGTAYLFNYEYHVPLISPDLAATLGTWTELTLPWFLGLGLLGRPAALILFVYNAVAVISYPALWPNGLWNGLVGSDFIDHKAWGLMLFFLILSGPGAISLDAVLERWFWSRLR
ncbi:MAG: DoxX family protein [Zetaproteobacteria bacterium]|nr:MAG: DoxX family protein [Zetaproteobacteria bacterium]